MTLGTRARIVEVNAPDDPSLECMRYLCSKGSSVSCLDPRHVHVRPSSTIFGPALRSTGQSPCRLSCQGQKAIRHPTSCRKLPLGRSTSWVRDVLVLPPRKGIIVAGLW